MSSQNDESVTIVAGLPRSGTSMMMRMLEAGGLSALTDDIRKADQDNPRGYYEFEPVKKTKKDRSWLATAVGKVVKMVHLLLYDLPEDYRYRVVFIRRNLDEVIRSQNVMLERLGKAPTDLSEEQIQRTFRAQLNELEKWLQERPNFEVLYVNYNDIVRDPAPCVQAVNEFLGSTLNTEAMTKVVEPGLYRQRK